MANNHILNDRMKHTPKEKRIQGDPSFSNKQVTFDDTPLFFPDGFEKLFLSIYVILLPYIAGLFFLFFYVAKGEKELFLSLNDDSSFILTWAIGYEILATLAILYIIKMALGFATASAKKGRPKFRRPN